MVVCLGILLLPVAARAAPNPPDAKDTKENAKRLQEGKEHFQAGQTHYSLGEFDQAVAEFREAYRLRPEPAILFNIAQALRQLKDWRRAYFYYSQFLSNRPDATNRSQVEELMTSMRQKMDEEDSLNAVNGAPVDPAAPGASAAEKSPAAADAASSGVAGKQKNATAAPTVAVIAAPPPSKKTFWTRPHIAGVAAAGAGVAAGALALVFHSSAQSSANTLNQKYSSGTLTTQDASLKDEVNSKGRAATICLVSGVALLAAGGVLAFAF